MKMKKVLVTLLALVFIIGTVATGFAAPAFEDIDDEDVSKAVARLKAFGIVSGYPDGTYKPEKKVTREEFAKLIVEALGLGNAADAAKGATQFKDVEPGRWSSGYINVAVGQGMVKGYPDGTFKPTKEVSYAEAVTMLVRALGYKDEFLPGTWPGNYIAKAAEEDITDDVTFAPDGAADRGSVAVLVNNTLDANIIEQYSYGDENNWTESSVTLLEDRLGYDKYEDVIVTATPKVDSGIDEDQFTFMDEDEDTYTFDVVTDINVDSLLGLNVNVYVDDDEIVYVEESDENYKVVYDVVDAGEDIEEDSITLVNIDKEYEFEEGYKIYVDNELIAQDKDSSDDEVKLDFKPEVSGNIVFGKFVLNNKGNIVIADLQKFDENALIVVDVKDDEIIYNETDADEERSYDLDDFDKYVIFDAEGNILDLEDVEKDDIIYINDENVSGKDLEEASSGDEVAYVVVVKDKIEGAVESYDGSEVEIAGKDYDWTSHATATISIDNDDEYELIGSTDADKALDDATDEEAEVVALLDLVGDVRHVRTDVESSSDEIYGIITAKDTEFGDVIVKILNYEEDEVTYEFDLDSINGYGANADEGDVSIGDIVKYTLDSDGEIDTISFLGRYDFTSNAGHTDITTGSDPELTIGAQEVTDDYGEDYIEINNTDYVVDDDVKVFDFTAIDPTNVDYADAEFINYADLADKSGSGADVLYALDSNGVVQFIVFVKDFDATDDEIAGYVVDERTKDGDSIVDVALPGQNDLVRYTVDDSAVTLDDEMVIVFEPTSGGEIDVVSTPSDDYITVTGMVYDIDGKYVTICDENGNEIGTYKVDTDALYYQEDDEKSFSDLDEKETMVTVAVKNAKIEVVKIYDIEIDENGNTNPADDVFDTNDGDTKKFTDLTTGTLQDWVNNAGFEY